MYYIYYIYIHLGVAICIWTNKIVIYFAYVHYKFKKEGRQVSCHHFRLGLYQIISFWGLLISYKVVHPKPNYWPPRSPLVDVHPVGFDR